jgi:hypothetical protein
VRFIKKMGITLSLNKIKGTKPINSFLNTIRMGMGLISTRTPIIGNIQKKNKS